MCAESTTPEQAELLRRMLDAHGSGDVEAMVSFYGSDAVWDLSSAGLGTFEGRAAIRAFLEDWGGSFEGLEIELQELVDLGSGVVLVVNRLTGRPAGSTADVQLQQAWVQAWSGGTVVRQMSYLDVDEARAAAGRLAEERGGQTNMRRHE